MLDFIEIGPSEDGFKYALMAVGKYTKLVEFVPASEATAIHASKVILEWGSRFGLPEWLISDGGRHLANHALRLVEERMGIRHHITLAHCPWSNGSVEVVGYDLVYTLRCVLSELSMLVTEWPKVLPLVQYAINHRPRKALGNRSPIEVMTGRAPDQALDLVLWTGVKLEDATAVEAGIEQVDKYCDRLQASLAVMHQEIDDGEMQRQRKKAADEANSRWAHHFEVGDLVMVTVAKTSVNASCKQKPRLRWQGPLEVTSVPPRAPSVLFVRLLGDPATVKPVAVHWTRCKRFAGKEFTRTPQLVKSTQHDSEKFKITEFVGWRVGPAGTV